MTDSHRPGVGDTLDERYRLVELVGTGGMAHVYRADDLALGRVVAVKVMHAHAEEQSGPERLRAEVSLLASVGGHSLVTLYDARVTGSGPAYLVMEFVTGPTLSERIAEGPLPVAELDALAADLAEALHIVHAAGIVHRDVKPSNVLLARTPVPSRPYRAKLADFGIAHLLDATRVTSPGLTVGTAAYIAPELLDGADPAPPSDIYALGLVLIEAATGRRAFGMTDPRAQLLARLTSDPFVPASLGSHRRELFTRMASRTPDDRPDAAELLTLLAAIPAGAPDLDEATAPVTILPTGALGATAAMAPPASTPTMADADGPTRTMVLPPAIPAAAAAAAAASSPVAAPAATGRRRRARRVGVWVASAAAAALLVTGAWSLAAGISPTAEPTPSTTPTVEVPAAPASEPPAPETVVVDQPTDDGATTDEGDGNSGNGNSGSNNSGNSGSGNGNSGNSGNGNGNGKGNGRGNG